MQKNNFSSFRLDLKEVVGPENPFFLINKKNTLFWKREGGVLANSEFFFVFFQILANPDYINKKLIIFGFRGDLPNPNESISFLIKSEKMLHLKHEMKFNKVSS